MEDDVNNEREVALTQMIEIINAQIIVAQKFGTGDLMLLLKMAKLSLQLDINEITDTEFQEFSGLVRSRAVVVDEVTAPKSDRRVRLMLGVDSQTPQELLGRSNLLFRVQDRKRAKKTARKKARQAITG